jgi:hypothetical protein
MHLLFIDESGNPPPPGKSGVTHFVLGGVIIAEEVWPKLAADMKRLKLQYNVYGEIKWRYFISGNMKPDNTLIHLNAAQRDSLRKDLLGALVKYKSVKVIAVVADIAQAYADATISNDTVLYHRAYKAMTERFQYFLQDLERTSGQRINGLIICDNRNSHADDDKLRELHQRLISTDGSNTSNYQNLVEGLFIAPSHHSIGIQYADLVAGSIFRKVSADDSRFYDTIRPLIRCSEAGVIEGYGVVRIPKRKK